MCGGDSGPCPGPRSASGCHDNGGGLVLSASRRGAGGFDGLANGTLPAGLKGLRPLSGGGSGLLLNCTQCFLEVPSLGLWPRHGLRRFTLMLMLRAAAPRGVQRDCCFTRGHIRAKAMRRRVRKDPCRMRRSPLIHAGPAGPRLHLQRRVRKYPGCCAVPRATFRAKADHPSVGRSPSYPPYVYAYILHIDYHMA